MNTSAQPYRASLPTPAPAPGPVPCISAWPPPAVQPCPPAVLDGMAAHVCVLDGDGVILQVNEAWRAFAMANGARAAAVLEGSRYLEVCDHPDEAQAGSAGQAHRVADLLRRLLAGALAQFEVEYPCHAPGDERWFRVRASRVVAGGMVRAVVVHDNITALKRAQLTLARSEALLLDLAASMPGVLFRVDARSADDWEFAYLSPGILALTGVSAEQACRDRQALLGCLSADEQAAALVAISAACASGQPWDQTLHIRRRDGASRWVQVRALPKRAAGCGLLWTGTLTDVTEHKRTEAALVASETTYRRLFETVPQGIVYHDTNGRITAANPAAQRILGLTERQMMGRDSLDPHWQAVHEDGSDFPGVGHPAMVALRTGRAVHDVVMGVGDAGGRRVWLLVNATPLVDHAGRVESVYASFEDITQRVQLGHELQRLASTDELTGVPNRRNLLGRLKQEFERLRRHPGRDCCVLVLDLDLFKGINDRHGHAAGDAMLVHVVRLMRESTRATDVVGRVGGEEFVVLLPDTGLDEGAALADRLRRHVRDTPLAFEGRRLSVTVSIGASAIAATDTGVDEVLARADRALYRAKAEGRDRVRTEP